MADDDEIIDALLQALVSKGGKSFDVFNELLYLRGPEFAHKMHGFFERSLEYYKLANKSNLGNDQFTLTSLGKRVVITGGWVKHLHPKPNLEQLEQAKEKRLNERRNAMDREVRELSTKRQDNFTKTMSIIAVVLSFTALLCSVYALRH